MSQTPTPGQGQSPRDTSVPAGATGRRRKETQKPTKESRGGALKEILVTVLVVLLISFLLKTFLFRIFFIPSESMENTLQLDDRIGVNVAHSWYGDMQHGDIVVFEDTQEWMGPSTPSPNPVRRTLEFIGLAPDASTGYLIKRVIGVGGDTVACCDADGRVTVNGTALDEPYVYEGDDPSELPFEVTVPEGHYFVMGDHRSASGDSRYHIEDGTAFIKDEDVVGTAVNIMWPINRWQGLSSEDETFNRVRDGADEDSGAGQ
ncbi:MAG: signal peptidase I [Kocuria sp.]|nr:signal peptidase I [Kocuria sp.]